MSKLFDLSARAADYFGSTNLWRPGDFFFSFFFSVIQFVIRSRKHSSKTFYVPRSDVPVRLAGLYKADN